MSFQVGNIGRDLKVGRDFTVTESSQTTSAETSADNQTLSEIRDLLFELKNKPDAQEVIEQKLSGIVEQVKDYGSIGKLFINAVKAFF